MDLSDDWVPLALREPDDEAQPAQSYRASYVALANQEYPPGPEGERRATTRSSSSTGSSRASG